MNVVFLTNTFTPHVGGVARSVEAFTEEYRARGHRVKVIAPEFADAPEKEVDVIRVPAIVNFNASDFSVVLPVPKRLREIVDDFGPHVVHSHHPFLLGMTAVRLARAFSLPLVFTHHTLYEQYTHYVPGDSPILRRFVVELATCYANLCDRVFAPSESIRDLIIERGVTAPVDVVPTGVRVERFAGGDGRAFRARHGIADSAIVIGHVGRLAPEKNLEFLSEAVVAAMRTHTAPCFVVIGAGPSEPSIEAVFAQAQLEDRLIFCGVLEGAALADGLGAMDVFAFSSKSETQGMVLTEAMAAGVPVVALDAPGAREVVEDGRNGRLIAEETVESFSAALGWTIERPARERRRLIDGARDTARRFSLARAADLALERYALLATRGAVHSESGELEWEQIVARIKAEWDILKSVAQAGDEALSENVAARAKPE